MSHVVSSPVSVSLKTARNAVLEWLREPNRNPMFLAGHSEHRLDAENGRIVDRFMSWVIPAGFKATLQSIEVDGVTGFQVHWTYLASELVGGKVPPPVASEDEARLLGAAALVQNDWCRARLL